MTQLVDPVALAVGVSWLHGWRWTGNFVTPDLIAAGTNALNGALLSRRPDHYKNFTIVGVILMALLMGLGGGMTRDVLLNKIPGALTNPAYIHRLRDLRVHRLQAGLRRRPAVPRGPVPVHDLVDEPVPASAGGGPGPASG